MKKKIYIWFSIGALLLSVPVFGQTIIVVEPDAGLEIGALNNAVDALDPATFDNTIFELRRGGWYYLNGSVSHTGGTLHIRAEEGDGARPILQPAIDETGDSDVLFRPGAGLKLENLYIYGIDELGDHMSQLIRPNGNDASFIFESCYFDYTRQSVIRVDAENSTISFNNCIIRNSLRPENPANGRHIDIRGNPTESITVTNSTLYNNGRDFIRMDMGFVKYLNWDHNTVYAMNFRGFEAEQIPVAYYNFRLDLTYEANVTNNIFYNVGYMQATHTHAALFFMDSIYTIGEYTDAGRTINLSNNNWWTDPSIGVVLTETEDAIIASGDYSRWYNPGDGNDSIQWRYEGPKDRLFWNQDLLDNPPDYRVDIPPIKHFIDNGQVDTSNIFREELTFENPPPILLEYWRFYAEHNFDRYVMANLEAPNAHVDEDPLVAGEVTTGAFNFNYNGNSRSATAAAGGGRLGDPRWGNLTSAGNISAPDASIRAFPNPFTDNVTFEFESSENSSVRISVYDLLGKEVYSVKTPVTQGNNSVSVDLGSKLNSGVYLYQIQSELPGGVKSIGCGKFNKK